MYVLIDATNAAAIAVSAEYNALAGLCVIQYANVDCTIVPLGENKNFSQFDLKQLVSIGTSIGMDLKVSTAYPTAIKTVRAALQDAEWLRFPFTKEQVFAQVAKLGPADDKPRYFNPEGDTPLPAAAWHVGPQHNRKREDASYWVFFSDRGPASAWLQSATGSAGGGRDAAQPPPAARPSKRPSARAVAPPAPGGTTPTPKPRAAPSGPATRPRAGSNAEKVWLIADEVFAANPKAERGSNSLRSLVVERCKAQDINFATAYDQYKKWSTAV